MLQTGAAGFGISSLAGCLGNIGGSGTATLNAFVWEGYGPILEKFTEETGIEVNQENAQSSDGQFTKIQNSPGDYDVAVNNVPFIPKFVEADLAMPIAESDSEMEEVTPNITNAHEYFRTGFVKESLANSDGQWYGNPTRFGLVAIGYNSNNVDAESVSTWSSFFDNASDWSGDIAVNSRPSYSIVPAGCSLGYTSDLQGSSKLNLEGEKWQNTRERYLELTEHTRALWDSESFVVNGLSSNEFDIATGMGMNTVAQLKEDGFGHIEFMAPEDGSLGWVGGTCALSGSEDKLEEIREFMNFLLRPEIGALFVESDFYPSVVPAAKDHLSDKLIEQAWIPSSSLSGIIQEKPITNAEKWQEAVREFEQSTN